MELTLTGPESAVLRETMEKSLDNLLMEIAHTDNRKFRDQLKERTRVVEAILAKLSAEKSAA